MADQVNRQLSFYRHIKQQWMDRAVYWGLRDKSRVWNLVF